MCIIKAKYGISVGKINISEYSGYYRHYKIFEQKLRENILK